jgi:ATP-dependent DNA helicase RecG
MIPTTEGINTEFKTSFNDDVIISLVAFCNAKGGTVYVGITDNGEAKGVLLGKETIADWLNEIKNKTLPAIIPNVDVIQQNNKSIVAFSVAEYPVKPVAMKGRYYQRRANSNHLLSAIEIADLSLQSRQLSWDSYPYPGASFDDLNIDKINRFISRVNDVDRFVLASEPKLAMAI